MNASADDEPGRVRGVVDLVMAAADGDPGLTEEAKLLLLAALTVDDDSEAEVPAGDRTDTSTEHAAGDAPCAAYLKSITVAGFRGVGPEARLDLQPGPGVVVVAGRNGSGKSSFSEAVEVALTRTSYRWASKSAQWRAGWRNLHADDPCRIRVELAEEGGGTTALGADWADGDDLGDGTFWAQRPGEKRDTSVDPLGWATPLEHFRPLLSYDELGGILEARPSQLYDRLSTVLGLGPIADAQDRLDAIVKDAKAPRSEANKQVRAMKEALAESEDARAAQALEHLKARRTDLGALERLATGVSQPESGELAVLRRLGTLTVPPAEQASAIVAQWRNAIDVLTENAGSATDALALRMDVLAHSLRHVESAGPGTCPVCGVGELDAEWAERTRRELDELKAKTSALRDAGTRRTESQQRLRALLPPMPEVLQADIGAEPAGRVDVVRAWQECAAVDVRKIDGPPAFLAAYERLDAALPELRKSADAERQRREDRWAPLATRLAGVVAALHTADEADARLATAQAAATWLKDHANELRNERLRPVAELAKQIWALLRQESNVDLGGIELTGAKTQRRVVLSAEVDGQDAGGALTVMSQGELHALALALFLPRATLPASPFGFVVVDDPVQAMDPAKVDGLARVLERIGQTHQVIVFTHDDRLPESVRRLGIDARILEVHRAEGSRVEITTGSDPASRYFDEAHAVARDRVDEVVWRRVIPLLCRMAVESACRELFMARRYSRGESRDAVEKLWEGAQTSRKRVALALRDDAEADLRGWVNDGQRRKAGMDVVTSSSHAGLGRDPVGAIRDVEVLVGDIRGAAR